QSRRSPTQRVLLLAVLPPRVRAVLHESILTWSSPFHSLLLGEAHSALEGSMNRCPMLLLMLVLAWARPALAANDVVFTDKGRTRTLTNDCTTDASIVIPNGFTLDLNGNTITAVDPPGGHFTGGVLQNAGASASVRDGVITASNLANVCDAG